MRAVKLAKLLLLLALPGHGACAADIPTAPDQIVVVGREPGPPLWKVSKGDNVLWIFPTMDWMPQDLLWDSTRVARVIAQSQEFIDGPHASAGWPKAMLLNPFSIARSQRMRDRHERNPDGGTLEDNLPPALYARFETLYARHFAGRIPPLETRPLFAGAELMSNIRAREGLVAGDAALQQLERLVRRSAGIRRTKIAERANFGDNYAAHAERMEALYASFPPALEQACFAEQLRHMEQDLDEMKSLASSWAQGYIDDFRNHERYRALPAFAELYPFAGLGACLELWTGAASTERENVAGMLARLNQAWLDAAEKALARNTSTFAILPINELVDDEGLLGRLKAKGYTVTEP